MDNANFEKILDDIPEPMRHFYKGIFTVLCYRSGHVTEIHEDDLSLVYSPSRSIQNPPSFYEQAPPLPKDATSYEFNPLHFLVLSADLDAEASIIYINLKPKVTEYGGRYWTFDVRCTEDEFSNLTDDFEYRNYSDYMEVLP